MTDSPLVVLGIDGLDAEKVRKWVPEIQQDVTGEMSLEEFDGLYYTDELWPSMILGCSPREYGWDPNRDNVTKESSAEWNTPGLNIASNVAERILPSEVRSKIGQILKKTVEDPAADFDIESVDTHLFTGLKSKAIEIPNWNRGELDLDLTRESWEYVVEEDAGVERFFDACESEIATISEETKSAMNYPYDIIFNHYHYLDLIQHYFGENIQRDWYERTAELVNDFVNDHPDTTVIVMSDHGLADGVHRSPAFITVSNPWTEELPDSPPDVRRWIESAVIDEIEQNEEITEHMRELGYIE